MGELVESKAEKTRISRPLRRYSNGALADPVTGRIVKSPIQDTKQAQAMARARWDKARDSFAAGIVQQMQDTGLMPNVTDLEAGAMQVLGDKTAQLLLDADNARGYSDLLEKAVKLADWAPGRSNNDQPAPGMARIDVDLTALADMLRTVRDERERRTIDIEIVEENTSGV